MTDSGMFTQKEGEISSANSIDSSIDSPTIGEQPLSNRNFYHDLFVHMNDGFAYYKVELDDQWKPVDYVFHDVNKAYRRLIEIYDKPIIGRKATEVIPSLKEVFLIG